MQGRWRVVFPVACMVVGLLGLAIVPTGAAAEGPEPYAEILSYDFGQSREALSKLEDAIREAPDSQRPVIEGRLLATLAHPDATYACRQFVLRMIGLNFTPPPPSGWLRSAFFLSDDPPPAVTALADLLHDRELAHMARHALQGMDSPAVDEALRARLPRLEGDLQIGVISTIAARGDRDAVALLGRLMGNKDARIARAAIQALGRIGGPVAARLLEQVKLNYELEAIRDDALLTCADILLREGDRRRALEIYRKYTQDYYPAIVQTAAYRGLVHADRSRSVDVLCVLLESKKQPLRMLAGRLLNELPGVEATEEFGSRLFELSPEAQVIGIEALMHRGDRHGSIYLVNAAGSRHEKVRAAAITALARIGGAESLPVLLEAVRRDDALGETAVAGLSRIGGRGVAEAMIRALRETDSQKTAVSLLQAMGERHNPAFLGAIGEAFEHRDGAIRQAAYTAAARLGNLETFGDLLVRLVEAEDEGEQNVLGRVAASLLAHLDAPNDTLAVVRQVWNGAGAAGRRRLAALTPRIATPEALEMAGEALEHPDAQLRTAAVRALAEWPNVSALPLLGAVITTDSDPIRRTLAFRGYGRMLDEFSMGAEAYAEACATLVRHARSEEEKKIAFAAAGKITLSQGLTLLYPLLDDAERGGVEAQLAYVQVATLVAVRDKPAAVDALNRVGRLSRDPAVQDQAIQALERIDQQKDYIDAWALAGPYWEEDKTGSELFDTVFPPEEEGGSQLTWRILSGVGETPWIFDLGAHMPGEHRVAYLKTRIVSQTSQVVRLELASDDGVKVWLNGQVIHSRNVTRGLTLWEDQVTAPLRAGENTLIVKVTQEVGDWKMAARLRRPDGGVPEGLRVYP